MKKDIKRESEENKDKFLILDKNNREIFVDKNSFLKEKWIDWIIRMWKSDFKYIKRKKYYGHFNLNVCNHKKWHIYWLPKILRFWYYNPKTWEEKLPLLSFEDYIKWECIEVDEKLLYSEINSKHFKYSIDYINNIDDLKEHIASRYTKSLKWYTKEEILDLWVSFTLLKLI